MRQQSPHKELIREGNLVAEVDVTQFDSDDDWSPTLSPDDARKLERVRHALRQGDLATVRGLARLFELVPFAEDRRVAAE